MTAVIDAPAAPAPAAPAIAELRSAFRAGKAALLDKFSAARASAPAATRLIHAIARHVDRSLVALWQSAGMPTDAALIAVGGYGRGELFPHSDVDVLVLLPPAGVTGTRPGRASTKAAIEGFISACWDIGLDIGSSVRTVDECIAEAQRDVTVQTALLESRYLCGSRRVFTTFRHANTNAMDPRAFLRAKTLEMTQRHQKYEDTPYALEPNCKESPGGLRDLQVVIWSRARRAWARTGARSPPTA